VKERRPILPVVVVAAALAVELVATAGWWAWRRVSSELEQAPEAGAALLVSGVLVALPPAVERSRRLQVSNLAGVEVATAASALDRVGGLQQRWAPTDPDGFRNRGRAFLLRGEVEAGLEGLEAAVVRDPTSPYLHRLLALVLRYEGRSDEFLDHMATAEAVAPGFRSPPVELTPEDERWIRREALRRRVELYPSQRVKGLLALASQVRSEEGNEAALEVLSGVLGTPEVDLALAEWDLAAGRATEAGSRAEAVASRAALPSGLRVRAWSLVARCRDAAGDAEGASAAADEALRLGPGSPAPYLALASLAERRQDWETALEHLRRAWGIAPADVQVVLRFAAGADRAGSVDDARLAFKRAVQLAPDEPRVAALLVEHYLKWGDYMAATMELSRALDRFPTDARLLALADRLRREVTGPQRPGSVRR
jgi:tetratricopeptide (TPR) repeat protein